MAAVAGRQEVTSGNHGRTWWRVVRVVLVAGWVVWVVLSWWSAPRQASTAQAAADLSAGRMVSYQWAEGWESNARWGWTDERTLRSSGTAGPLFSWRTTDWRVHHTEFDRGSTGPDPAGSFDGMRYSGPQAAAFDQAVRSAARQPAAQGVDAPSPVRVLPVLLLVQALVVLVVGPDPVRGTRWFWFWVLTGMPLGLGLTWWLARERPWHTAVGRPPEPTGRDPRDRWYVGLLVAIAASIVASILLYGLRHVLGDRYVPFDGGT
ncbi:hypothetical protein [Micromonospora matsumotoense]|uniref:hypothetical protein n=1 Tax=Micromonospora matsumotoense TaxID=121616 RepID=UPI0034016FB3